MLPLIPKLTAPLLIPAWAIADICSKSDEAWERSGHQKTNWILLCVFTQFVGALLYFVLIRPRLEEVEE